MTLAYDDIPGADGTHVPTETVTAWQAVHAPILTIRVWTNENGVALTNCDWHQEIQDMPVMCKPLELMGVAILAAHRTSHAIGTALVTVIGERDALMAGPKN